MQQLVRAARKLQSPTYASAMTGLADAMVDLM